MQTPQPPSICKGKKTLLSTAMSVAAALLHASSASPDMDVPVS